jgi:hypothetical protein
MEICYPGPGEPDVNHRKYPVYLGIVLAALAACSGEDPQQAAKLKTLALGRRLSEIAAQANMAAPADIDPNTRLEGVKAGPGLKLTSTYTLLNPESQGIDSTNFETKLVPVVKEGSCKNPDLGPLINQGVVVVLEYRGNDGKPMGTVSIDRNTCASIK